MKDIRPNTLARPAHEAIVERLARAIDRRCVNPTAAGSQYMNDPADYAAIINPRLAARIGREMRLQSVELFVVKPEKMLIHQKAPFGNLESQTSPGGNPFYGSWP